MQDNLALDQVTNAQPYKRANLVKVSILGSQFLLMFSAFNSAQNLIALLYEQSGLGSLGISSLWVLYLVYAFGTLFSNNICSRVSPKYTLFFSGLMYSIYLSSGILVSWCYDNNQQTTGVCSKASIYTYVLFGAALCGLGASTLWVAQGQYIQAISTISSRGMFFGIFWALFQSSQILGNVLGLVLVSISSFTYFVVMTIVCLAGAVSFIFLPNAYDEEQQKEEVKGITEKMRQIWVLFKSRKMRPLLPYFVFNGAILAFYTGFLFKLIKQSLPGESDNEIAKKSAYVFIVLGVFENVGAFISGFLSDRANRYLIATGSTLIVEIALVLSIICYYQESYALCFVTAALWGMSDCIVNNMCNIITTTLFPDQIEGFSIKALLQSLTVTIVMLISVYVESQIVFILIIAAIEIITNVSTSKLGVKGEK
ncbi:hypothetical protein pb186bvf_010551 [Paramecium bursaria]